MVTIAITGSLGSGKSTAARIFRELGAKTLDADKIAHEQLKKTKSRCYQEIVKEFGEGILTGSSIDRKKLAEIVFMDLSKLSKLEGIVHPAVKKVILDEISRLGKLRENKVLVVEVPLLFESHFEQMFDYVLVVASSKENQIKRAKSNLDISREEAERRINRQMPLEEKINLADFVVDNNGSINETKKQIKQIWGNLIK